MSFNYKDLTYIRAALEVYEASLMKLEEDECTEDEFSEAQDDIMYIGHILGVVDHEIKDMESSGPSINPVRDID